MNLCVFHRSRQIQQQAMVFTFTAHFSGDVTRQWGDVR